MTQRIAINALGRRLDLEYAWTGSARDTDPTIVFLHEGLGSASLWREFPERLCEALGFRGLVYSRFGYGRSTPRPHDERFPRDYLRREAVEVLPALLDALDVRRPWLFGHSDGGTIALLAAAHMPERVRGIVVLAPHIFVEDSILPGILKTRDAYVGGPFRNQLARHHDDPDSAFYGWFDIWSDPAYRDWNIETDLDGITCPVLAVQGENDEYASLEQIRGIQRRVPSTQLIVLQNSGHSSHRDQTAVVIRATADFIADADTH
jgi:pimeloyl-ACP methyl ester carboxylesterase